MTTYSVDYDLGNPGRDYTDLIAKIKSLGNGWCHAAESHWFINSASSAGVIRDGLTPLLDANDRLIVHSVGDHWATLGVSKEVNDWLTNNWQSACSVT